MSIIVSNCQHCDEQQFQTLSCVQLHDFLSSKVRFIHTSTVTGSHSCSGKTMRTSRVHLVTTMFAAFYFEIAVKWSKSRIFEKLQFDHA